MDPQICLKKEYWRSERELWLIPVFQKCIYKLYKLHNSYHFFNSFEIMWRFLMVTSLDSASNKPIQGQVLSKRSGFSKHLLIPAEADAVHHDLGTWLIFPLLASWYTKKRDWGDCFDLGWFRYLTYISSACVLIHTKKTSNNGIEGIVFRFELDLTLTGSFGSWFAEISKSIRILSVGFRHTPKKRGSVA